MTIRPYLPSDAPILQEMENGFPYPDPKSPMIEACLVVVDDDDEPVAAITALRMVELYMHLRKDLRPAMSKAIIDAMHTGMAKTLKAKGYSEANAFLPPSICERFGKRLMRSWGWTKNWSSLCRHF